MKHAALGLALLTLAVVLPGCTGTGALFYCLAVDHDVDRRCQ